MFLPQMQFLSTLFSPRKRKMKNEGQISFVILLVVQLGMHKNHAAWALSLGIEVFSRRAAVVLHC